MARTASPMKDYIVTAWDKRAQHPTELRIRARTKAAAIAQVRASGYEFGYSDFATEVVPMRPQSTVASSQSSPLSPTLARPCGNRGCKLPITQGGMHDWALKGAFMAIVVGHERRG